jgi:prepilin-type N-terminal cleavage/methylation domain-containing protein
LNYNKKTEGFTLVEIMIVVAIIGLLTALGSFSFGKARKNTQNRNMENNARLLSNSIARYAIEKGLSDNAPVTKAVVTPYLKNGWDGMSVGNIDPDFPENKTVAYWEKSVSLIASELYGNAYAGN